MADQTRKRFLSLEPLENRNLLAQLTVITHGRMDQIFDTPDVAPEWAFDLASAINVAEYGGLNTQTQIDHSVVRYDASSLAVPAGGSSDFLIFNWAAISDVDHPGTADDDEVAGKLADLVRARFPSDGTPLDIHFIGHSRGSYVTLATINDLNNASDNSHIGNLRMTTLDPQDYGIPGINTEDLALTVPSNVDYAENYYQYMFPLGGGKVDGADVNDNLTVRLALWNARSPLVGAEHLEVVDRYYWSIDTDDAQTASYLRDDDLVDEQQEFMDEAAAGQGDLRTLLFGPDPIEQVVTLLETAATDFADGLGDYFHTFATNLEDTFGAVEVPIIGDQLRLAIQPMTDSLQSFGADARDVIEDILEFATADGGLHVFETLQGGIYMLLGPGSSGLDKLTPEAQEALAPLAGTIDAIHLGLLLDGPDLGDDISPSDIVITMGSDLGDVENVHDPFWAQVDFRLGQFKTVDLPKFDLGLSTLANFVDDPASAEQLQTFLDNFGFNITSGAGLRANLRWDLRFGAGVSALPSQRFYLNSGATASELDTGEPIEELRASVTVFAVPPNESETFSEALFDATTTDDLRSEVSLGLMQAEITDGTPKVVKVTAAEGLDIQVIDLLQDFSGEFDIIVNESETIHIDYDSPAAGETLPQFLLGLNALLIAHYGTPFPSLSFTLDFGSIYRAANPDVPTTPSLVLVAHGSDIHELSIAGAEEYKFLALQHEDHRGATLGFGNNTASGPAGSTQVLEAELAAPAEGVTMEHPGFVLWIGGQRVEQDGVWVTTGATPVLIDESIDADVSTLSGLSASLALLNEVHGLEGFRSAVEGLIQNLVGTTSSYDPQTVTVELHGDRLAFVSHAAGGLMEAPLLTVTYHSIQPTKLTLAAAIDVTDPNFNELSEDENDQRTFNRLTKAEISANSFFDVFVPVLKGEAEVRLHVATNASDLTGFLEQNLGLGEGSISLPQLRFDFKLDAAMDLTTLFAGEDDADDVFVIDTLQFDNVELDVSQVLQSIVVPLAQAAVSVVEPVLDVIGHSADDADALLNQRLPVISDIVNEDITVKDILAGIGIDDDIEDFIATLQEADELADTVSNFVNSQEFLDAVGAAGNFRLGGWELVMNPDSPLFFPRTEVPVPIDLAYAIASASEVGLESFTHVFTAFDQYTPAGFKIDLFGPKTILNMMIGEPFNIVSYGLPKIDADAEASFGFEFEDLQFDIAADAAFNANLRLVYDSYGLAEIVSALRAGADPDWTDLLDGFAVQNDPDGYELGGHVGFEGSGQIGPITATDPISGDEYVAFEASGSVDLYAELGLELHDPNSDGKLRLDEIFDLTDDFTQPQNLFCIFDIQGAFSVEVAGSATVLGVDLGSGDIGLSTGDFSLQDLLSSAFGICEEDRTPILAEEIVEDGQTILRLNTGPFASARLKGDTTDNTADPFPYIIENADGSATLIDTSGEELLFTAPGADGVYGSPDEDDTTLTKVGGLFEREFRGGTVHRYNASNALAEIDNGLSAGETYTYDAQGRLTSIQHTDGTTSQFFPTIGITVSGASGNVVISGLGATDQVYTGNYAKIVATGSPFDDSFDFSGLVGIPVEVDGLAGNDVLRGGSAGDTLVGGGGDDQLTGNGGDDQLDAGGGDNSVWDGAGNDFVDLSANSVGFVLTTGGGNDVVLGSAYADTIAAPAGSLNHYHFEGGAGNDVLTGADGNDELLGDDGDDQLVAGGGQDTLTGGYGDDGLNGGAGNDELDGEQGDDLLDGGTGADGLYGRQGDDQLIAGLGDTLVDGGTGDDHVLFRVDERPHQGTLTNFAYEEQGHSPIPYLAMESLAVELGNGFGAAFMAANNYVLTIDGPTLPLTQVTGGTGSDLVTVASLPGNAVSAIINLGGGDDRLTVMDSQRAIMARGGAFAANGDELIVERSSDVVGRAGSLSATQIIGLGLAPIDYDSIENLELRLGAGFDQFTIHQSSVATSTTVQGGGGDDHVMIEHVAGATVVNGNAGTDVATVVLPGNPNLVQPTEFAELTFSVETLEVDNRANPSVSADWTFNSGQIFVGPTKILDSLGAEQTVFLGGGGQSDSLTVQDDVDVTQFILVDGSRVEIQEGANVLTYLANQQFTGFSYDATVDGLNGVADAVVSPDGLYVYAVGQDDDAVVVFRRTAAGHLDFVQALKDGQFGVDGLDGAGDIVISPDADGRHVYVASSQDASVAVFERIPQTGRLVYRGRYQDAAASGITHLAISPSGEHVYGTTSSAVFHLTRQLGTGELTFAESRIAPAGTASGLAASANGQDLFVSTSTGLQQWHVGAAGALPAIVTSTHSRAYQDVSTGAGNTVYAAFDGGIAAFHYADSALGSPSDTLHVTAANKALATAVAVDRDDNDRLVASFDKTSVDATATTYTLRLLSIYAEGDGQDVTEGNIFTPGWELYAKVNGVRRGKIFTDFDNDGTTKSLNIDIDVTSDVTLELWEDDGDGINDDDRLYQYVIDVPFSPANWSNALEVIVTDTGIEIGRARLSFQVITNVGSTPTTQPVAIFEQDDSGQLDSQPTLVTYTSANKFDSLATSPATADFVGTSAANDLLALFGDGSAGGVAQHLATVRDDDVQHGIVLPALSGADDVQTAFSVDGIHAYSISAKYGTISVYPRDITTGELGNLIQVIPAGLLAGASIAFPPFVTRNNALSPEFAYVTNPAEDSVLVYQRNRNAASADFGKLTLVQVLTDGVAGIDGLAGAGRIVISDDFTPLVYVAGQDAIAVFSADETSGQLTFIQAFRHADLGQPSGLALVNPFAHSYLYVTSADNDRLLVLGRDVIRGDLTLSHVQTLTDGMAGNDALGHPVAVAVALSSDVLHSYVYVAAQADDAISVFERDFFSGELTLLQTVREGSGGVAGIAGITSLAVDPQGQYLVATGGDDTLTVFTISAGQLTMAQRVRDGAGLVQGIDHPQSALFLINQLYVSGGGPAVGAGGVAVFDVDRVLPPGNHYVALFSGMESLTVQSAGGSDIVNAGEFTVPFTLRSLGGADAVTLRNTPAGMATTALLGDDDDSLDLLTTGAGATTTILGGDGADDIGVFATAAGAVTAVQGQLGGDTILVKGGRLGSTVTVIGDSPSILPGDTLIFDAHGLQTVPIQPAVPAGSVRINRADHPFGVSYNTIEQVSIIGSPLADAGGPYTISEGGQLTLSASGTGIPSAHTAVTYDWSISGAAGVASGVSPTLLWTDLAAAGVNDSGTYQVAVTLTSHLGGESFTDTAAATLTILNAAPTLSLGSNSSVEAGSLYTLTLSASDPGDDAIDIWQVNWGDGTPAETFYGQPATALHRFAEPGDYQVSVLASDEDGQYGPALKTIAVTAQRYITGNTTGIEGSPCTLTLGNPSSASIQGWTIHWGDGSVSNVTGSPASINHTYADDGAYRIMATTVSGGSTQAVGRAVEVSIRNAAPAISGVQRPAPITQGTPAVLTVQASDPGTLDTLTYEFDFDANGVFEVTSDSPAVSHRFTQVGTFPILVRVRDDDGGVSDVFRATVQVVNADPTIDSVNVGAALEGTPVRLIVGASDPGGDDDRLTYDFDFDNDGTYEVSGSAAAATHTFADDGDYPVRIRVRDQHGGVDTSQVAVVVQNVAPSFTPAFASARVLEGSLATISIHGTDPAGDNDPLTYQFDLDNNGSYETENSTGIVTHVFPDDGDYVIPIRISDGDGGVTPTSLTVSVGNVAPTIALSGAAQVAQGESYTLHLGAVTDPGDDQVTQYIVRWGDGTETTYAAAGDVTHVYQTALGEQTIHLLLVDEDGTHPLAGEHHVLVTGAGVVGRTLFIIGTEQDDHITVSMQGSTTIKVDASFLTGANYRTFDATTVDRIVIYANGGDDQASVSGGVTKPVIADGGLGNDRLNGGGGGNVLLGGGGNDQLIGGAGRDILVGGFGADQLIGQNGDDVVVGGFTTFDSDLSQWRSLDSLLGRWSSTASYADRVADMKSPADPQAARLAVLDTVFDDDAVDELIGSSGLDWFLADSDGTQQDLVRDLALGELLDDLLDQN